MKASELRIGNLVLDVKNESHEIFDADDLQHIYLYNPIPITEEWLVRFGFEKFKDANISSKEYYRIGTFDRSDRASMHLCIVWDIAYLSAYFPGNIKPLKYIPANENMKFVHQLQNLYFALIGKELKYV